MMKIFSCFCRQQSKTEEVKRRPRRKMVIVGDGECGKTCLLTRMSTGQFVDIGYLPTVFETEVIEVNTGQEKVELLAYDTAGQEDYDRLRPLSYTDVDVAVICFSLAEPDSLVNVIENWSPEIRYFCGDIPVILVGNKKDIRDTPQIETASFKPSLSSTASLGSIGSTKSFHEGLNQATGDEFEMPDTAVTSTESRPEEAPITCCMADDVPAAYTSSRHRFRHQAPVKHSEGALMARRICALAYFETSALTGDNVDELLLAVTKAAMLGSKKAKKFKPFIATLKSWRSGPLT